MNKDNIIYGLGGILVGIIASVIYINASAGFQHYERLKKFDTNIHQQMMTDHSNMGSMEGQMNMMMEGLKGKTGEDFDKVFLKEMIVHHQGAIDMANAALKDASHDEIKNMAQDIIDAQTKEIEQMKAWQDSWFSK